MVLALGAWRKVWAAAMCFGDHARLRSSSNSLPSLLLLSPSLSPVKLRKIQNSFCSVNFGRREALAPPRHGRQDCGLCLQELPVVEARRYEASHRYASHPHQHRRIEGCLDPGSGERHRANLSSSLWRSCNSATNLCG